MIPLKVSVEGFLSYRECVELDFSDKSLWMLTGDNGAGKSTIFDAMTLALFDSYRGDAQRHQELINQNCDQLSVSFEFQLGNDVYRAVRTVPKKGVSTRHIEHVSGPNAPNVLRKGKAMEPDTDKDNGFKEWVKRRIGLDMNTFSASMLLRQGEADKLLKMEPKDLHDALAQLVDLSAYERLQARIEQKGKYANEEANVCRRLLQEIPSAMQTEVDGLTQKIESLQVETDEVQAQLTQLSQWKQLATQWYMLTRQSESLTNKKAIVDELVGQAERIVRNAERFDILQEVLPQLQKVCHDRTQLLQRQSELTQLETKHQTVAGKLQQATANVERAKLLQQQNQSEFMTCQQGWQSNKLRKAELIPVVRTIEQYHKLRQKLNGIEQQLETFDASLDMQLASVATQVESLNDLKAALPALKKFADARRDWLETQAVESDASGRFHRAQQAFATASQYHQEGQQRFGPLTIELERCQKQLMQAESAANQIQHRLVNLESIDGLAECPYCGHALTSEHLAREHTIVSAQLQVATDSLAEAQQLSTDAKTKYAEMQQTLEKLNADVRLTERAQQEASGEVTQARRSHTKAGQSLEDAFQQLAVRFQSQITSGGTGDVAYLAHCDYPSFPEIQRLQAESQTLANEKRKLTVLQEHQKLRDAAQIQHSVLTKELNDIPLDQSEDEQGRVLTEVATLDQVIADLSRKLNDLTSNIKRAENAVARAQEEVDAIQAERQLLLERISGLNATCELLRTQIVQHTQSLPDEWQKQADHLEDHVLSQYQSEFGLLADVPERLHKLHAAQQSLPNLEREIAELHQSLNEIPIEARLPIEDIDRQYRTADTAKDVLNISLAQMRLRLQDKQQHIVERERLERESACQLRKAQLYKMLAQLLGHDGLRHHLLEQTQTAIVDNANDVLNRISNGTLRLEHRPEDETAKSRGHRNLFVYNSAVGPKRIPPRCLSGGQRFRVSIALALGIGQYATRESQQVESVIVDEGFGSLDEAGRQDMIDALHALTSTLKRIIIVSHQPEFANAFNNRYQIELVEGASRARLL